MSTQSPIITLVGHCRPDIFALTAAIRGFIPGADVQTANTTAELERDSNLYLVNRVLDGQFSTESGIELIKGFAGGSTPSILITNIDEHAQAALEAGALPGFGKANMRSPQAEAALKAALKMESPAL